MKEENTMSKMIINIDRTDTVENKPNETIVINNDPFDYVGVFDNSSSSWERNHEYNEMMLKYVERKADDILRARGYIFLNEIYDMLGMKRTKIGQISGWVYNENKHVELGFGSQVNVRFINGDSDTFVVEPNVDGVILHRVY